MKHGTPFVQHFPESIITLPEMAKHLKRSPKTIWRMWAKDGSLPKPLMINGRTLGWRESTYSAWLAEKEEG